MEHPTLSYQLPSSPDLSRRTRAHRRAILVLTGMGVLLTLLAGVIIAAVITHGAAGSLDGTPSPSATAPTVTAPAAIAPAPSASSGPAGGSPPMGVQPSASADR